MARAAFAGLLYGKPPLLFLISVIFAMITPNHAFHLAPRDSDSCPSSYQKCGAAALPGSFCCPSSSTCISLDNASSAICCPKGQACTYIEPINCNVQLQNATLHPTNPVKTTRLEDQLPKCGNSCCPFGYKCKGNQLCAIDNDTSSTTALSGSPISTATGVSSTISVTSTTSDGLPTTDLLEPTTLSPSDANPSASNSPMTDANSASAPIAAACPSFPTQAIVAGFFPGAVFGAVLASAAMFCWRRRRNGHENRHGKLPRHTSIYHSTPYSISHPIPSEESSYRTDFLLGRSHRGSSRSVLHRTGTRVKSLFGSTPKVVTHDMDNIPKSIRVYTPPGGLPGTGTQKRGHYISIEPDKGFVEMFDRVGFMNKKGDPCFKVAESPGASRPNLQT
ncbi:hypothetical protein BDV26DRAFT_166663 [Aspergillus bertholletiae]|uniref:Uncharacterized protein n=1 Tax=Aspergillus bertholletiae TaxID=1226010 RepID=A0A5N7BCH4_9EURO|nr:hypothetical protein BDV26DRAFT_166663 [Aspergillus bertholletiae]